VIQKQVLSNSEAPVPAGFQLINPARFEIMASDSTLMDTQVQSALDNNAVRIVMNNCRPLLYDIVFLLCLGRLMLYI